MLIRKYKQGYTLVEAIIYVALLAIFFYVIVNTLLSFTRPYKELIMLRDMERSALESMEKMSREVRLATTIDTVNSTFSSSPGVLTLVATSNGVSTTTRFYVDSNTLKLDINGVYFGPLTNSTTRVTSLVFHRLTNTNSDAVKIDLTIETTYGSTTKSKKYYSTIILKGV